jgi:Tfp pilus assembly protein PilP
MAVPFYFKKFTTTGGAIMKRILVLFTTLLATLVIFVGNSLSESKFSQKIFDFSPQRLTLPPVYDPSGKPDPFRPVFSDTSNSETHKILQSDCISNPVLEKLSLSQLELSGIVLAENRRVALVQEADQKGHMIAEGMCIGIHGGKVAEIMNDRIIIQTRIQDVSGKVKVLKAEMKMKKRAN